MLDMHFVRDNVELIKENLEKRFQSEKIKLVDELINADKKWRSLKSEIDTLRAKRNKISLEINELVKKDKDASHKIKEVKEIPNIVRDLEQKSDVLYERITSTLIRIPNILHKSVPIGKDSSRNKVIRKYGKIPKFKFQLLNHAELAEKLKIADFDKGREVAGQGFNYLLGELASLDLALQRYGVDFLLKRKFKLIMPPMMLNREALNGAVVLSDFENVIYKIESENLHLIGTAEHSLVVFFKDRIFDKNKLPIKVCAVTPCFRKEIGGHGIDTKGLFRMHQFNKVEQVVVTLEENSFKMLEEMEKITEDFFRSLKIPFRVVEICSGDLGAKFARQYDIEAYFPRQKEYKEVTSAGNVTNYQAVSLNIKYMDNGKKKYCHLLNNTMVATSRAIVTILENYQQKDGSVKIPKVLVPYMNGIKEISPN